MSQAAKESKTYCQSTLTTSRELYNKFYTTMNKILSHVNTKEARNKIFLKSSSSKKKIIVFMIAVAYCLITIPPILAYGDAGMLQAALIFPGIGFTVLFITLLQKGIAPKIFGIIWGLLFGGIPWSETMLPALTQDPIYLVGYIVGIACILCMFLCLNYLDKRTSYGNEMLGKIKGFKNFLETAEKDKLEAMVEKNPTYFYDILPYTYVLGVSDKWIKKFETISLQAPTWYDSPNSFDVSSFGSFMNSTMTSANSAMSSSPSDSGGGGSSSGGGSSGGGSGGGGGGSW